jgi:hypothetical protein
VTQFVDFPFITSQWKSSGGRSTLAAQNQAARDGAAVVNSLHHFYSSANRVPSAVDTCHFSLVCDVQYGEIWLHWKEKNTHHMEVLFWFSFRDQTGVQAAIDIVANIIEYALGSRLRKIRAALSDSSSISSNTISNSPLPVIFKPPLTPNDYMRDA